MQKSFSAYLLTGVLAGLFIGAMLANIFSWDKLIYSLGGAVIGTVIGSIFGFIKYIKNKKDE